jgi:hypothetical protein
VTISGFRKDFPVYGIRDEVIIDFPWAVIFSLSGLSLEGVPPLYEKKPLLPGDPAFDQIEE